MTVPAIIAKRSRLHGKLDPGADHVIDFEIVPRNGYLSFQSYEIVLIGQSEVDYHQCMDVYLSCWWLPVYGSDQTETVSTLSALKTLADRYIPKIEDTAPKDTWSMPSGDDAADAELGDVDTALLWRPDRLQLEMLTNVQAPTPLYKRVERLGYMEQKGFRTGNSDKTVYGSMHKGFVSRGIHAVGGPGYVVWILTIPNDYTDGDWSEGGMFPENREFYDLGFLALGRDVVTGNMQITGDANLDDLRRWSLSHYEVQNSGLDMYKPTSLAVRMNRQAGWKRIVKMQGTRSPDQGKK